MDIFSSWYTALLAAIALNWGVYFLVSRLVLVTIKSRARAKISRLRLQQKRLETQWGENLRASTRSKF